MTNEDKHAKKPGRPYELKNGYEMQAPWPVLQSIGWRLLESGHELLYCDPPQNAGDGWAYRAVGTNDNQSYRLYAHTDPLIPQLCWKGWAGSGHHIECRIFDFGVAKYLLGKLRHDFTYSTIQTIVRPRHQDQLTQLTPHQPVDININPGRWELRPGEVRDVPVLVIDTADLALTRFFGATETRQLANATAVYLTVSKRQQVALHRAGFVSYYSFIGRSAHEYAKSSRSGGVAQWV